jgi:hypothetical protein
MILITWLAVGTYLSQVYTHYYMFGFVGDNIAGPCAIVLTPYPLPDAEPVLSKRRFI